LDTRRWLTTRCGGKKTMRKILLILLVCLSSTVNAQFRYDYPLLCDSTEKIIKSLGENYKEILTWGGKHSSDNSAYSLWINEKEGSWTLLKMTLETSCILGVGTESKIKLGTSI
jgi:hypothetical protein